MLWKSLIIKDLAPHIFRGRVLRMKTILIVEDEQFIREIIVFALKKEGYLTIEASNGAEAIRHIKETAFDLALLDVMLPDTDGFILCRRIMDLKKAPVMMLTAKSDITDKLTGLELGADDYITKPFNIREVLARIQVVLRRSEKQVNQNEDVIHINDRIKLIKNNHEVMVGGTHKKLKLKEYKLLLLLAENPNIIFSRERLLDIIWGYDFEGGSRTVDVHVQRLRKKLEETKEESIIKTVFGVGYKLV